MLYQLSSHSRLKKAERMLRSFFSNGYKYNFDIDTHLYDYQRIEKVT